MFHLYNHGGSGNHGCEAIVRSTAGILQKDIALHSSDVLSDEMYGLNRIVHLKEDVVSPLQRKSLKYLAFAFHHKLTSSDYLYTRFAHKDFFSSINKGDTAFSIGGDNYCYNGTDILAHYNRIIHRKGAKTVLWGCSVEPELLKAPAIAKDLASYDLITARESISYEALKTVNPNTVLVADPAFTLERVDLPLPDGWVEGNMIGINASPLILQSGKDGQMVLDAYKELIKRILETTDCSVALIPHVVWESNDDRVPLKVLHDEFAGTGRVILIEDHNCMELKGYIARCRMFIGARTHATIAAYSSCVPTLVLGYSVKSRGIARDLFGTEENYVIPVQNLSSADELANGFDWLLANETAIREHLQSIMLAYKTQAYAGLEELKQLR